MNKEKMLISNYSDEELYSILDVSPSVSDRELESIISQKITKYSHSTELCNFFNEIYDHFFEKWEKGEKDEDVLMEGMENKSGGGNGSGGGSGNGSGNGGGSGNGSGVGGLTTILPFSKDNLNPLLNQSIKKIITIDSQYRDSQYPFSTQFSFDLNDPLRDVVSLKLYSIQIPYTWYTINKDYGSNFMILEGNAPGINTGDHDYIIDISAGNYGASNLVSTLNSSFQKLQTLNPDINFGNTGASYNTYTSLAKISIDLTNRFTESNYKIFLPSSYPVATSLPDYLGFNASVISTASTSLYLQNIVSNIIQSTNNDDLLNAIYTLDASNNFFTIIQYKSTIIVDGNGNCNTSDFLNPLSTIVNTIKCLLSLPFGTYSRNTIVNSLIELLLSEIHLSNSELIRTDITSSGLNIYYSLTMIVRLNNKVIQTTENNKIVVLFPTETAIFPIWTGINSCLQFNQTVNELSETLAKFPLKQTNYLITQTPTIYLKCDLSGYDNSFNNFNIIVPNSPDNINGYSLNDYLTAINDSFHQISLNTSGVLVDISGIVLDATTSFPTLFVDINNIYITADYNIDFTDCILNDNLLFDMCYNNMDISGSLETIQNFSGQLRIAGQYNVPKNKPVFTIFPRIAALQNIDPYIVPFIATNYDISSNLNWIYYDHNNIATDIQNSIQLFQENSGAGGSFPLTFTTGLFNNEIINNSFVFNLFMSIKKVINQTQYTAYLYDVSGGVPFYGSMNSWKRFLFFDAADSYDLALQPSSGGASIIFATAAVENNSITLVSGINDTFFIQPLSDVSALNTTTLSPDSNKYYTSENGFQVGYPFNYIRITIPVKTYFTYIQLINAINNALDANLLTRGSFVSVFTQNNNQYTKIRWNINKTFTASDYNLVFYNSVSFVKCFSGDSSVRNTTWDTTLGWILGFQKYTQYNLSNYLDISGVATIEGETSVNVNLYNYLLLSLDDFNQNRLNDGVVTITKNEIKIPLPSYTRSAVLSCDASGNNIANASTNVVENNLTLNQLYSINQILNSRQNPVKSYTTGPFVKDIFGFIPLKVNGLQNGQSYVEFGGTLQQQERLYFGPVNIHRMSITLYTDKGTVLDLNGTNWSFSFVGECLYQKQKL
jgi:hypothetical protein